MLLPQIIAKPSARHGLGLFATEPIPLGTVVWHPCARCPVYSPEQVAALGSSQRAQLDEYGYFLEDGSQILPCGLTFLANHCCDANVLDYGLDFGIAVRDIAAGEEVTGDYRTFFSDPSWQVQCACGTPGCVGLINPVNALPPGLADRWMATVTRAVSALRRVDQPLDASLKASSRAYAADVVPNPDRYSIRTRRPS